MTTSVLVGLAIGSISAALSWLGNQPGRPSAYPDLLSMLAPALMVWLSLRLMRPVSSGSSYAALCSGPVTVTAGALVFALGHVLTVQRQLPEFRTSVLFVMGFVGFMAMGGVGLGLAASRKSLSRQPAD